MAVLISAVSVVPNQRAYAEIPPGFSVSGTSQYSFTAYSRTTVKVYKTITKTTIRRESSGPFHHYIETRETKSEKVLIGETECIMSIGTSNVLFAGETHKVALIRQIMNPKTSYCSLYAKNIYGVNRSTELTFNYVNPYYEMDYFPEAVSPTGTESTSISCGLEGGYSDGIHVVGSIQTGRQSTYNKNALTISTTKNGSIRKLTYSFSSNDAANASKFQGQVNSFCKSSYKALYSVMYSRKGTPTHQEASKRIVNNSTYWCQKISGVTGTGGSVTASASFNNSMY